MRTKSMIQIVLTLTIPAIVSLMAQAQTPLTQMQIVGKPEKSATEFVASSAKDQNGRVCSAIQVVSDLEGFYYDSYNGVIKSDHRPGMDMVYLSPDERVLQVFHSGFLPLKIILSELGVQLQPKDVWVLKISGERKLTKIPVAIIVQPGGAEVTLDGASYGVTERLSVSPGTHEIRLKKEGFEPIIKTEIVDESNALLKYELKKIEEVPIEIKSDPLGAAVYIDAVKFGVAPISNFYKTGRYPIRLELDWYVPYEDYIEIATPATRRTFALRKNFGSLAVTSTPESGLDIYINDELKNVQTPHKFERLKPGTYRVRAKSKFFETKEQTVEIQREGEHSLALNTEANYALLTVKTLPGARVLLNGQALLQLENIRLEPMVAVVRAELFPKGKPVEQRLVLKKQENLTVEVYPEIPRGTIQVASNPFETKITLKGDAGELYTAEQSQVFKDIPIGQYQLEVQHSGYYNLKKNLLLKEKEVIKEIANLEEMTNIMIGNVNELPISISCWTFRKFTFEETLEKIKLLGIHFIEAFPGQLLSKNMPGASFTHEMTDSQIEWIKKELNEYNLKLVVYGVLAFDSTQESMRPIFIFSKKLGIKVILAEPSLDDFKLIEKMAQEYDIKVAIHNHPLPNKYAIPQTVLDHIQGLDNHVGACPDIGHWMRSGIQPIEGLQLLKGYLLHIHLTDLNDFGKKNAYDVPLGAGKANIKEILNELAHQNYNGFLSIDYLNEKEAMYPEKSIIKSLEYFRKISMNQ